MKVVWAALACLLVSPVAAQPDVGQGPEQVHVGLAEDGIMVHWAVVGVPYGFTGPGFVEWQIGDRKGATTGQLVGTVVPGTALALAAGPLHTYVYAAQIDAAPGETVTYSVGGDERGMRGPFTVDVPAADTLRFLAYGDIGIDATAPDGSCAGDLDIQDRIVDRTCPAHAVRDLAVQQDADLLVIPGDLAYSNSASGWNAFQRFMEPIQSSVATMPAIGNHEYYAGSGYHQFLAQYELPGDEMWFTYTAGPVAFVVLNSNDFCGQGHIGSRVPQDPCNGRNIPDQSLAGVEKLLQEAAAYGKPWTVVYFHHPPYSHGRHGNNEANQFHWTPLFDKHGVDLVVNAHDHLYSRSYPIRAFEPTLTNGSTYQQGDGIVYVVTGGGGRGLYDIPDEEPPAWHAAGKQIHHLTVFDVNRTHLRMQAIDAWDHKVFDSFVIEAGTHGSVGADGQDAPAVPLGLILAVLGGFVALRGARKGP